MRRPNLASRPFLNTRPVWVVSGVVWVAALALTGFSTADFLAVRGQERNVGVKLAALTQRQAELSSRADALNRELSRVNWKKLKLEVDSVSQAAAQRQLRWGVLLADLEAVMPWDVRLVAVSPTVDPSGNISVSLDGVATNREAWLKFLARLVDSERFVNPIPRQEQAPGKGNAVGYEFSLSVTYRPEALR